MLEDPQLADAVVCTHGEVIGQVLTWLVADGWRSTSRWRGRRGRLGCSMAPTDDLPMPATCHRWRWPGPQHRRPNRCAGGPTIRARSLRRTLVFCRRLGSLRPISRNALLDMSAGTSRSTDAAQSHSLGRPGRPDRHVCAPIPTRLAVRGATHGQALASPACLWSLQRPMDRRPYVPIERQRNQSTPTWVASPASGIGRSRTPPTSADLPKAATVGAAAVAVKPPTPSPPRMSVSVLGRR